MKENEMTFVMNVKTSNHHFYTTQYCIRILEKHYCSEIVDAIAVKSQETAAADSGQY